MKLWKLVILMLLVMPAILPAANLAYAEEQPYLVLEGPDVVTAGSDVTYTISTVGGTDGGYTWWLGYVSNNAATIEDGVLTALNPGIAGIRVAGNDTGALAELHVEIVPNGNGGVRISGPDKVSIGQKVVFSATSGGVSSGTYYWFIIYSNPTGVAAINGETGELEGLSEGTAIICAVDAGSGLAGEKEVLIVPSEKQAALVSITAGVGEGFTLDLMLSIKGDIPEDASLYLAVMFDDVIYYLPNLSTSPEPFLLHPEETYFEKVLSVPVSSIPYNEYTFYAALLNSSFEFVSNLDTAFVTAGVK